MTESTVGITSPASLVSTHELRKICLSTASLRITNSRVKSLTVVWRALSNTGSYSSISSKIKVTVGCSELTPTGVTVVWSRSGTRSTCWVTCSTDSTIRRHSCIDGGIVSIWAGIYTFSTKNISTVRANYSIPGSI